MAINSARQLGYGVESDMLLPVVRHAITEWSAQPPGTKYAGITLEIGEPGHTNRKLRLMLFKDGDEARAEVVAGIDDRAWEKVGENARRNGVSYN